MNSCHMSQLRFTLLNSNHIPYDKFTRDTFRLPVFWYLCDFILIYMAIIVPNLINTPINIVYRFLYLMIDNNTKKVNTNLIMHGLNFCSLFVLIERIPCDVKN